MTDITEIQTLTDTFYRLTSAPYPKQPRKSVEIALVQNMAEDK